MTLIDPVPRLREPGPSRGTGPILFVADDVQGGLFRYAVEVGMVSSISGLA